MRESRSGLIRWGLRAAAASFALVVLASTGSDPQPPRAAPLRAMPEQGRLRAVPPLAGMAAGEVRSVLAVDGRLHYGQSIWNEAGVAPGPITIRVDREAQILSVFRGGHEIATTVILYGAPEKPTPAGRYPVLAKKLLHVSNSYGAEMPYTLWLTRDGIAIHASSVREGAATHGCIGVPREFAERLYELVQPGVPVVIA